MKHLSGLTVWILRCIKIYIFYLLVTGFIINICLYITLSLIDSRGIDVIQSTIV